MSASYSRAEQNKFAEAESALAPLLQRHGERSSPALRTVDKIKYKKLSPLEKKTALIHEAMEDIGMGRYSWFIFFLCGYGYMLDLMWAQGFGLIATAARQEFGVPDTQFGTIFMSFNIGLTVGAFVWGVLGDMVGRRWAFNFTVLITAVHGLLLGLAPNWAVLCVLATFTGFGIGGNIPIDASIVAEFVPQNHRHLLTALSLFQPLGVVICSVISYMLIPPYSCAPTLKSCLLTAPGEDCCTREANIGWRFTTRTIGIITLVGFILRFVVFRFQESPKFLLTQGRDQEAVAVVHHIAKVNRKPCSLRVEDIYAIDAEMMEDDVCSTMSSETVRPASVRSVRVEDGVSGLLKAFFTTPYLTRLTVFTWLTYVFDYAAFSIAGSFLPDILRRKGVKAGQSTFVVYRNYIIIYSPGIVAVLVGAALIQSPRLGFARRWAMTIAAALMGGSLFMFNYIDSPAGNVGFNALSYFFQSMFNALLYSYTPLSFPSEIRGSACGIASTWGRLSSIVAPLIATMLLASKTDGEAVVWLAGSAAMVAAVATMGLPVSGWGGGEAEEGEEEREE